MSATDDKLRRAFDLSGLERCGWTFERAMDCPSLKWSLSHRASRLPDAPTAAPGSTPRNWSGTHRAHLLRRYGDIVHCSCGRQFDLNDPDIEGHQV